MVSKISSLEIAELTGYHHVQVVADICCMCREVEVDLASISQRHNGECIEYHLDFEEMLNLVSRYEAKERFAVIKKWNAANNPGVAFLIA